MNPRRVRHALPAALVSVTLLSGCLTAQAPAAAPAPAATPAPTPAPAPAARSVSAAPATAPATAQTEFVAPPPIKFEDAVTRAGRQLFRDAQATLGTEPRLLVVDPLIDANTGAQTISTAKMGDDLEALAKKDFRSYAVTPLTRNTLATKPLLLIGTLTPVNIERSIDKQPDAFRVWLTLIDLRTGKVVAKALDRATVESVNPEPLPFYRDSPTWHKDNTILGYINSCQVNTKIGDLADPNYLARLPAAAVINEAILAYDDGKVPVANRLYKEAQPIADPGDLRVLNGLYITNWQLGKKDEARDAFGKLVSSGLELKRLPMKLLFQPGRSTFINSGDLPAQYTIWLASLAQQAGRTDSCVRVVGHTSRTGSARANETLSRQRAEVVQKMLERDNRALASKLSSAGAGSKEALVGLGTDDSRDALDRRVEFRVVDCV
ncbi:MAG: OmpA family protein [Burkholderiales bacterium]|nr:OmpA family protein [Burkholderiales bacterium]